MKRRLRIQIDGMTCTDCEHHVTTALEGVGATDVHASFRRGEALVTVSDDAETEALLAAVAASGYRPRAIHPVTDPPSPQHGRSPRRSKGPSPYDLAIVGSGGAAFASAIRARDAGASVVMIERGTIGGTCVNIGCVPSKTLLRAAEIHHLAQTNPFTGLNTAAGPARWDAIIAQKDALVSELRQHKYEDLVTDYGWELVHGEAAFADASTLHVGDRSIAAKAFLIATGARPAVPSIPGLAEAGYLTSTTALELRHVPESIAVIGSGYIALELGQLFAHLGSKVTLMQRSPKLLKTFDPEISEAVSGVLADEGIEQLTEVQYLRVEGGPQGRRIHLTVAGRERVVEASAILVATGRQPNTEALHLEAAGVRADPRRAVLVDAELRTNVPHILGAGDVTLGPQFVYVAAYEGAIAADNALGAHRPVDLGVVPSVTFTSPAIATVGLTEAQAKQAGYDVKTSVLPMSAVPRALVNHDTRGVFKLVADAASNVVLGAHIVADNAGDAIYAATLAVKFHLTVTDLTETMAPYLTMAEGLKLTAQTFGRDVNKLSCCAG